MKDASRLFLILLLSACCVFFANNTRLRIMRSRIEVPMPDTLRCAIDLRAYQGSGFSFISGYNYYLLKRFADDNGIAAEICLNSAVDNYLDSLSEGKVNLVVIPAGCMVAKDSITLSPLVDSTTIWAMYCHERQLITRVDEWLDSYHHSEEYEAKHAVFTHAFNPFFSIAAGLSKDELSPYDDLFRQYADSLRWDWRLLAAVAYKESGFHIEATSGKGAVGLMQIMPSTADRHMFYGENLLDPEKNIAVSVKHIGRLERMFRTRASGADNVRKFTLAAYNAGEGHILDCIHLAEWLNVKHDTWEDLTTVFPTMRDDYVLQIDTVKSGKFKSDVTEEYVNDIYELYDAFCALKKE